MRFQIKPNITPVAQPRHRVDPRSMKHYIPADHPVHAYKQALALVAVAARPGGWPLDQPVYVVALFGMPRPKYMGKGGREPHTVKPDIDNLIKSCFDAMKGGIWRDDTQVAGIAAWKFYVASNELAGVELTFDLAPTAIATYRPDSKI